MRIETSLLSIFSAALLLLFCVAGNEILLDSISVDFSISSADISIDIHPVWLVSVSQDLAYGFGGNALAYGNVMLVGEHMSGSNREYVINHERIHIEQFRALGWLTYPAEYVLAIEPPKNITTNWNDKSQPSETMWSAPSWWPYRWSFITLTFDREET